MMVNKIKDYLLVGLVLCLVIVCIIQYIQLLTVDSKLNNLSIKQEQINNQFTKSYPLLVSKKDLDTYLNSLGLQVKEVKDDIKKQDATIVAVGHTISSVDSKLNQHIGSLSSKKNPIPPQQPNKCLLCDLYSYTLNIQMQEVKIGNMPYAYIEFDASRDKPWTIKTDSIDISVDTVLSVNKENIYTFYHSLYMINKDDPSSKDKKYFFKVVSSEYKQVNIRSKSWKGFSLHTQLDTYLLAKPTSYIKFTNPNLGLGISFSMFPYGLTKDDNDYRLLDLGVGIDFDKKVFGYLGIGRINIGKPTRILSDLWFGTGVGFNGSFLGLLTLGTTL